MRINNVEQAPSQPVRERKPVEESQERIAQTQEKPPELPRAEGPVGRNLDV